MKPQTEKVHHVKGADDLENFGDYYFTGPNAWTTSRTIVLLCPFCKMPSSYPSNKIKSLPNEPLTMEHELVCPYSPLHRFNILEDDVTPNV